MTFQEWRKTLRLVPDPVIDSAMAAAWKAGRKDQRAAGDELARRVKAAMITYRAKLAELGCEPWIDADDLLALSDAVLKATD